MKTTKVLLIPIFLLLLIFVPIVFASTSSSFLPSAQKFINNTCNLKSVTQNQLLSLYCYLFYKVQEQDITLTNHETRIKDLEATVTPVPGEISSLQSKVSSDEAAISGLENAITKLEANQPPQPTDFVFFNNILIPLHGSVVSQTYDANGYSKITFSYQCSTRGAILTLFVSPDGITGAPQYSANSSQCLQGGSVTLDTGGRYYTVEISSNPDIVTPQATVYAIGHFQ